MPVREVIQANMLLKDIFLQENIIMWDVMKNDRMGKNKHQRFSKTEKSILTIKTKIKEKGIDNVFRPI